MSIARNIKELRESHNLTQAELGKIAGVSDKAVSTWENGTAEPRMGAIQKIADHFHISKGSIIDEPSSSASDQTDALFIEKYGRQTFDVAMKYDRLDQTDRIRAEERIDTLLEDDKYKRDSLYGEKAI